MTKKSSSSKKSSRSDNEIQDQLLEQLGPGPMRFGPVCQEVPIKQLSEKHPDEVAPFVTIKVAWEGTNSNKKFTDEQILRFARYSGFNERKALRVMKRSDPRYFQLTAAIIKEQLDTKTIFPVPGLKTREQEDNVAPQTGNLSKVDCLYMQASRFFPDKSKAVPIQDRIDNLVYVMECVYERKRPNAPGTGMCLVANFADFEMSHFSADCFKQFMQALQGRVAPNKVTLFLIVNPPSWFDKVWKVMKLMMSSDFINITHIVDEEELWQFFDVGYEDHLPDEFATGKADTKAMVEDFVAYRFALEDATGRNKTKRAARQLGRKIKAIMAGLQEEQSMDSSGSGRSSDQTDTELGMSLSGTTFTSTRKKKPARDDVEAGGGGLAKEIIIGEDLSAYSGISVGEKMDKMIKQHLVVMVEKTWCPYCVEAKKLMLTKICVDVHVIQVDKHSLGKEFQKHLVKKYNFKTVPAIYIKGEFLGGFDDINDLHNSGELEKRLTQADRCELEIQLAKSASKPLFWFPQKVNAHAVRATGCLTSFSAIASAALYWTPYGSYIAYFLFLDFCLRILAGSFLSPLGRIGGILVACKEPKPRMGRPKQFAACCGFTFSLLGSLFYTLSFPYSPIVGAVFMGGLAIACGLEGFFDFCLGCVFFRIGIQIGVFPK